MKKISSETICNFFYFFFVVYASLAVITLIGTLAVLFMVKMPRGLMFATGFQSLIMLVIASTAALFYYLICDRALLSGKANGRQPQGAREMNPDMMM
jgi:hypothetical protein